MPDQAAWRYDNDEVAHCADTLRVLVKKIDEIDDVASPTR